MPAGVQVLRAVDEVERGQQHLAGQEPVRLEPVLPGAHQPVLADGRDGLEHGRVRRALLAPPERRPAGGDGARGDDHHGVPGLRAPRRSRRTAGATVSSVTDDEPTFTTAITRRPPPR